MKARDLTQELQRVWTATTVDAKKEAMKQLIEVSYGRKDTKEKALRELNSLKTGNRIDQFAVNYTMSGEGLKVA